MSDLKANKSNTKIKSPKKSVRLTHKKIAKTSPLLFVPAFIILVTAIVLGSFGNGSKYTVKASNIAGINSSEKIAMNGLVVDLNFDKNAASYSLKDDQKIINLVNEKPIATLGSSDEKEDSDPVYDENGFFTFDGKQQYINLDGKYAPKNDFTYEIWVRSESIDQQSYIIASNNNNNQKSTAGIKIKEKYWWFMGFNDGNKVYLPYPDKVVDQSWHHIAITRSSEVITVFVDGLPAEVSRSVNKFTLANDYLTIGATHEDGKYQEFFNGDLAQLRIYNRPLTNAEIVSNIKNTRPDFIKSKVVEDR